MKAGVPVSRMQTWLIRGILAAILLLASLMGVRIVNEPAGIDGVVTYNRQARGHDDSFHVVDGNLPPVGGLHHSLLQNCGVYLTPIASEKAIHSIEHGAVWITYQPALSEAELAHLQRLFRGQEYLLLSPFPGQQSPIVLTAWGVQLQLPSVHDERLEQFVARYMLGPTIPERGASCTGSFGDPLP